MYVRKSKINQLIKKERERERQNCLKESSDRLKAALKEKEEEYNRLLKELKRNHDRELLQKDKELKKLYSEIESNYQKYKELRQREQYLDELSGELEYVVGSMVTKVQESLQPFYRAASKVEVAKRRGDKSHDKVESIFKAVK